MHVIDEVHNEQKRDTLGGAHYPFFFTRVVKPHLAPGIVRTFTTRNQDLFQPINQDILKNLELLLHSNISNCYNIEVEEWRVYWPF